MLAFGSDDSVARCEELASQNGKTKVEIEQLLKSEVINMFVVKTLTNRYTKTLKSAGSSFSSEQMNLHCRKAFKRSFKSRRWKRRTANYS